MPNKKTIAAIEAARKGETEPTSLEQLANEWNKAECGK